MTRVSGALAAGVLLLAGGWGGSHGAGAAATVRPALVPELACDAAAVTAARIDHTTIQSAVLVDGGSFTPARGGAAIGPVPPFCRVEATVSVEAGSTIRFETWIPRDWNGKVVVTGNGGYSNALNYRDMALALSRDYAAAGGDTGHQTPTPDDLLWGVDQPIRILDWGTRSIHAITGPARAIVERVGGARTRRAYFYGCSTGGHQGYAEIQRYPADFDGVIAGAPGNNRIRLTAAFLWQFLSNHEPGDNTRSIIPAAKLPMITRAAVAACDAADGVSDGVVDDPRRCAFDPAAIRCRAGDGADCLTAAQVAALEKMYGGAKNPRTGEPIYPGWPPTSEALTAAPDGRPLSGWHQYWGGTEPARAAFWRHWVFADPQWNWWSFDFDRDLARADARLGRMVDQVDADLAAFQRRGGKAIVYHGWQDPVANPLDTIAYYERVRAKQGSQRKTDEFFRLFLVPGMGHCSGGTGATSFGNQNAPAPVADAAHDLLSALDAWVERGVAPRRLIASRVEDGKTVRTRPLCPYPQRALHAGRGSTDSADSFVCR